MSVVSKTNIAVLELCEDVSIKLQHTRGSTLN